jgi:hypothetical protein
VSNIRAVLGALARHGVATGEVRVGLLSADDLVDGHREKTLGLLWKMILHWQVGATRMHTHMHTRINM